MAAECMSERQNIAGGLGEANSGNAVEMVIFLAHRAVDSHSDGLEACSAMSNFCPSEIHRIDAENCAFSYVTLTIM